MKAKKGPGAPSVPEQLRFPNDPRHKLIQGRIIYRGSVYKLVKGTLKELCYAREDKLHRH